jgi:hypothetical protein
MRAPMPRSPRLQRTARAGKAQPRTFDSQSAITSAPPKQVHHFTMLRSECDRPAVGNPVWAARPPAATWTVGARTQIVSVRGHRGPRERLLSWRPFAAAA